jgi:Asp-tRNA(Asn)/Glu-tRNA(Gln) amidotransferase B subunit
MKTAIQTAATLLVNELLPRLNRAGLDITKSPVLPGDLALLAMCKGDGLITTQQIRGILDRII